MKKLTLTAIRNYLETLPTDTNFDNPAYDGAPTTRKAFPIAEVIAELDTELNRNAQAKTVKAAEYDGVRDLIMNALSDTPVTIGELYDALKEQLPSGFTKGKLQYAVTKLFAQDITKIEGNPNTYKRA